MVGNTVNLHSIVISSCVNIAERPDPPMCRTEIAISGDRQTLMLVGPVDAKRPLTMGETGWS